MTTYVPEHYGPALNALSQEDRDLLVQWSDDMLKGSDRAKLGQLDRLIERMPPLGTSITVYRAIRVDDWKEIVLDIDHFVATATNAAATRYFADTCCFMAIRLPPEAKVIPLSYQHGLTRYPKDMEVLLPRHGVFKVVGSQEIDLEPHGYEMFGEEIAALMAKMTADIAARSNRPARRDVKLFVNVDYMPSGRMTRSLAQYNTAKLAEVYEL